MSTRTVPARRPREVEIIDVDALPDEDVFVRPSPAQRRRTESSLRQTPAASSSAPRTEVITIYDSDEEVERGLVRTCYDPHVTATLVVLTLL